MSLALWAAIREYIAAEMALNSHRSLRGNPVMTAPECKAAWPILYDAAEASSEEEKKARRDAYEEMSKRQAVYASERSKLEEQSTRTETEVRRLCEEQERRIESVSSAAHFADRFNKRY